MTHAQLTSEEWDIYALPDELRQAMACYVLAGWQFRQGVGGINYDATLWRAFMPNGTYYSIHTLEKLLEEVQFDYPDPADPTNYRGGNKPEEEA